MKCYYLFCFLLCFAFSCNKDYYTEIKGKIVNEKTLEPIEGAIVKYYINYKKKENQTNPEDWTKTRTDTTDVNGNFQVNFSGDFTSSRLLCEHVPAGYVPFSFPQNSQPGVVEDYTIPIMEIDSWVKITAINDHPSNIWAQLQLYSLTDLGAYKKNVGLSPFMQPGETRIFDSIPIVGDKNYQVFKDIAHGDYDYDTIFLKSGYSEVEIRLTD